MKSLISSFVVGFLFAIGLGVAGMTQPQKVIGFLDFFGQWNPALAFVMIGAIGVHSLAYFFILKKASPILDKKFYIPENKSIDFNLIFGSCLFGMGWGLGGFCPGPALTSLVSLSSSVVLFCGAMILGVLIHKLLFLSKAS